MFELLLALTQKEHMGKDYPGSGPGPTFLQLGDESLGYFGELPSSEFITRAALKSQFGVTGTDSAGFNERWIKLFLDGKIVYVPTLYLVSGVMWNTLYSLGLVYGIDGPGAYPIGTPVNQLKRITVDDYTLKVRLLKDAITDPSNRGSRNTNQGAVSGSLTVFLESEAGRVLSALLNPKFTSSTTASWKLYNPDTSIVPARLTNYSAWAQNYRGVSDGRDYFSNVYNGVTSGVTPTSDPSFYGTPVWFPVIELENYPVQPPGPQEFLVGDKTNGYYGNLTSTEFFKSSELATAVGISGQGAQLNEDTEWMKVSLDGKTLYVPFKQLRTSLSWGFYDQAGLTGRPGQPKKIIEKGGLKYWVRMMTGLGPGQPLTAGEDPVQCVGSEFNRIMYRMCKESSNMPDPRFADYTVDDLNLGRAGTGPAGANLSGIIFCQEYSDGSTRQAAIRNLFNGIAPTRAWTASGFVSSTTANSDYGWRPVLELVE